MSSLVLQKSKRSLQLLKATQVDEEVEDGHAEGEGGTVTQKLVEGREGAVGGGEGEEPGEAGEGEEVLVGVNQKSVE
jgi:hypothetical protein